MEHISVLKGDVQKYLELKEGSVVVDATLGLGGHALMILESIGKSGKLIAFEEDERNLAEAKERLEAYSKQVIYIFDNFRYLKSRVTGVSVSGIDAILFDLGLSSPHVDDSTRGFSFIKDGPLDMRFDLNGKLTASDVINGYSEENLARVFFEYGEERMSRKIARKICERRHDKIFSSTVEFADFLKQIMPRKNFRKVSKIHPATKIFQSIRIEVNDELNALKEALEQTMEVLKIGGRVAVISYHSLEDRIVKQFFKKLEMPLMKSMQESVYSIHDEPIVKRITRKPVVPTKEEILENPRSRSAKLRVYEKLREMS